ncbi:hypothetical protein LPJ78_001793 [Coemansia sp. RSA 989]|nr:hypothetical protein LPJ78_001793 [Coemansia sp. RSA 989]
MTFDQTPTVESTPQPEPVEPISDNEKALIRQLRRLTILREEQSREPKKQQPLCLIKFEGRSYLEIRTGHWPILVPMHMREIAQQCLSENIRRYMPNRNNDQQQQQSPPLTPQPSMSFSDPFTPPMSPPGADDEGPQNYSVVPSNVNTSLNPDLSISAHEHDLSSTPACSGSSPAMSMPSLPMMLNSSVASLEAAHAPYVPSIADSNNDAEPGNKGDSHSAATKKTRRTSKNARHSKSLSADSISTSLQLAESSTAISGNGARDMQQIDNGKCSKDENNKSEHTSQKQLRKPQNAFMIYRGEKNRLLRQKDGKMRVDCASKIIGKLWKEEDESVKEEYRERAELERQRYFVMKKEINRTANKKSGSEGTGRNRKGQKAQESSKSKQDDMVREIALCRSQKLSAFSPEALSQQVSMPPPSISNSLSAMMMPQATSRHMRSLTMSTDPSQLSLSLGLERGSETMNSEALSPTEIAPSIGRFNTHLGFNLSRGEPYLGLGVSVPPEINQQVATSLEQLGAQFSQPTSPLASLTSMALDMPATTAALQSLTSMSTHEGSSADWPTSQPAIHRELGNMFDSLFSGN